MVDELVSRRAVMGSTFALATWAQGDDGDPDQTTPTASDRDRATSQATSTRKSQTSTRKFALKHRIYKMYLAQSDSSQAPSALFQDQTPFVQIVHLLSEGPAGHGANKHGMDIVTT